MHNTILETEVDNVLYSISNDRFPPLRDVSIVRTTFSIINPNTGEIYQDIVHSKIYTISMTFDELSDAIDEYEDSGVSDSFAFCDFDILECSNDALGNDALGNDKKIDFIVSYQFRKQGQRIVHAMIIRVRNSNRA